jgi:predicted MFS family arabinose efflux permease
MQQGEEHAETLQPAPALTGQQATPTLNRRLTWTMAVACGLTVANIYYCQPLLVLMARSFDAPESAAGVIATVTSLGFALGLLLLVPLGDIFSRRNLISSAMIAVVLGLVAIALAPSLAVLAVASLIMAVANVVPQMIVPFAASLARPEERGRVVGTVMSGLLIGILLARTVSGFVGAYLGWRAMYWIAAILMTFMLFMLYFSLPGEAPREKISYPSLLRSLWDLLQHEPVLHEVSLFGGLTFSTFQVFWVTLTFFLSTPLYHFSSDIIGLFGLVGVVGAVTATLVGKYADTGNPRKITGLMMSAVLLTFVVFLFAGQWLWGLILGVILLDMGTQGAHISNQTRIYARPQAIHSRLNTVYMFSVFIGGAFGSALGTYAWSRASWPGVCILGVMLMILAQGTYLLRSRHSIHA